jgi:WD40 repeat protein/serine/threonine protein kinase
MDHMLARFDRAFWVGGRPSPEAFLDVEGVPEDARTDLVASLSERMRRLRARERQALDEFAAAWERGVPPRIEDTLGRLGEPERSGLLQPLLRIEFRYGGGPPESLLQRLPDHRAEVMAALEDHLTDRLRRRFWSGVATDIDHVEELADALPTPLKSGTVAKLRCELLALATRRAEARSSFEQAIRRGHRPSLEDAIDGRPEPERSGLLGALVRIELFHDATVGLENYRERFASTSDRAMIHAAFQEVRRLHSSRFAADSPVFRTKLSVIHEAQDHDLGRVVALKRNAPELKGRPSAHERLRREALITGRLEHPNILPVYGLGIDPDGQPSFAMRFYDGQSLDEAIGAVHARCAEEHAGLDFGRVDRPERALLVRLSRVCRTVAYAHEGIPGPGGRLRVIHGDIKSRNILVSRDFATALDFGEVYCIDWGMARLVGPTGRAGAIDPTGLEPNEPAVVGAVGGTPEYMSPEQAAHWLTGVDTASGRVPPILEPSDIYNLGATLYEVLVGQPPMRDVEPDALESRHAAIARFLNCQRFDGLVVPASHRVPAPLAAICRRATRRAPEDRYPSAAALATDLDSWLADQPVAAYRDPWSVRLTRAVRRHRVVASAAAVATVGLLAVVLVGLVFSHAARRERAGAAAVDSARLGDALCEDGALVRGLGALARARDLAFEADRRELAEDLGESLRGWNEAWARGEAITTDGGDGGQVVAFCSDARWVVRTKGGHGVEVWRNVDPLRMPADLSRPESQPQGGIGAETGIVALAISSDGSIFAGGIGRGVIWTPSLGGSGYGTQLLEEGDERLQCAAFGGDLLVLGTGSGAILPFRRNPRATFRRCQALMDPADREPVTAVAVSQDGRWIAAGSRSGAVRVWRDDGSDRWSPIPPSFPAEGIRDQVSGLDLADASADSVRLAIAWRDGEVRWSCIGRRGTGALETRSRTLSAVSVVSLGGELILTGGRDGSVRAWTSDGLQRAKPIWHPRPIRSIRGCPGGDWVLVADDGGGLWVDRIEPPPERRLQPDRNPLRRATAVAFRRTPGHGQNHCAVGGDAGRVVFFDLEAGREFPRTGKEDFASAGEGPIAGLGFDADGRRVWVASTAGQVWSWDGKSRIDMPVWEIPGRPQRILAIAVGDRSGDLAVLGERGTIVVVEPREVRRLEASGASTLALAPDGTLFVGFDDGRGSLYRRGSPRPVTIQMHGRRIGAATISADSKWLLTGSEDLSARLWALRDLSAGGPPLIHGDSVIAVAFRPPQGEGTRVIVATGSEDRAARLWNAVTGQGLGPRRRHEAPVLAVAFHPSGSWLATGSSDGSARLLPLPELTPKHLRRAALSAIDQ